jgi:hypothetical protein
MKEIVLLVIALPALFLQVAEPQEVPKTQRPPVVQAVKHSPVKVDAIRAAASADCFKK